MSDTHKLVPLWHLSISLETNNTERKTNRFFILLLPALHRINQHQKSIRGHHFPLTFFLLIDFIMKETPHSLTTKIQSRFVTIGKSVD